MSNTIRTHADARDVLHAAAPGATIRIREYPRTHMNQAVRTNERLVEIEPRTFGSSTGVVAANYSLPCDADELARYIRRRIDDALQQRQGRMARGETFMADGE